jgi:hypothetical protein
VVARLLAAAGAGVLAVFLVVVLILGYVVIWAIWHFGFRDRDDDGRRIEKRREDGRP